MSIISSENQNSTSKEYLNNQPLPLVIRPENDGQTLTEWVNKNKLSFNTELADSGAILFRGFNIDEDAKFENLMKCFNTEPLPYMFRSSPRAELNKNIKNIYLSTTYPNDRNIRLHNETSYSRIWGRKIVFCCIQPADIGGETPIADSRKVLWDIPADLREKFRVKGVKYVRHLFPQFGMQWQEVFQTSIKTEAQSICNKFKIDINFIDENQATISWVKSAIYNHPDTKEESWFNHIYFFNKYSLFEEIGLSKDDFLPSEMLPSNTYFGDGSEISFEEYESLKNAYNKNTVSFAYEKGDVLFLDNMLVAHGRNPFEGKRVIATAIIEAFGDSDIIH
jgi:alpha-ketoglutarate-dependent taurine dioxygenase